MGAYSELGARQNARIVPVDENILGRVAVGHSYMAIRMTGISLR